MIDKIGWLILITLLPALELRASIPIGILDGKINIPFFGTIQGFGMNPVLVFIVCVITNIILGIALYFLMDLIVKTLTRIKPIEKLWKKYTANVQKRIHKAMEKYGELGLAIFIGVPLPGSGVYTGCVAAYLLGLSFKKTLPAIIIGVLIAAIAVTALTLSGGAAVEFLVHMVNSV